MVVQLMCISFSTRTKVRKETQVPEMCFVELSLAQMVKCLSTMWETWIRSLGWEDSVEKKMANHSSTLALKIPWTEELGAGYYPWGHKELGTTERLHFHFFTFTRLMVLKSLVNFHSCPSPFQMEHKQTGDFVLIKISKILTFSPDDNYIFSH